MKKELNSFNVYHSYLQALEPLSDAECGRLLKACIQYSMTGEVPELRGNEKFLFPSWKSQIDRDRVKYNNKCEQNQGNALKRWHAVACGGNRTHAKHAKDKDKDKDNNTPHTPQGDDTFAEFWSAYPRKDSKAKAKASWDKLNPDKELVSRIMAALEQHKRSDQWTRDGGQYIPYPATWLNQRRWEDEGITQTPPEPPKNPEGPAYRKETDPETGEEVIVWLK